MLYTRSTTGCFACKTKRKKCDETKPHCLRCQKSGTECPGYTYIQNSNNRQSKLRTIPAPRTLPSKSRALAHQGTPSPNNKEPYLQLQDHLLPTNDQVTFDASYGLQGTSVVTNPGISSEAINVSDVYSFAGSLHYASTRFSTSHTWADPPANPDPVPTPSSVIAVAPLTSGQASLLEALLSLGQPPQLDPPPSHTQPSTRLLPNPSLSLVTTRSLLDAEQQDNVATHDSEDLGGVASVVCRQPVLDKTAESNALPFVLQSYAAWVSQVSFEPLKLMRLARDLVCGHFGDGEQARWIMVLVANIGGRVGSVEFVEGRSNPMLSILQNAVRWRLEAVMSQPDSERLTLITALGSALETMFLYFYISPLSDAISLIQAAAPIFRQLCPDPPGEPINLPSLLQHPLSSLRLYAGTDILFNVVIDMPMLFRYEVAITNTQHPDPYPSTPVIQSDGIIQWRHGMSDQIILVFAKMKAMRQDGSKPSRDAIESLERDICEIQPPRGSSSERFLAVMRSVVNECWRQAAFIYLYMAVRGEPSSALSVKQAFKGFMKLLNGTRSGRIPDEFLILPLILISPAAQRNHDREAIRRRLLGLHRGDRTHIANYYMLYVIEDCWARADAEGRSIMWSDVAISRMKVLGV